jgi:hypothetical protein
MHRSLKFIKHVDRNSFLVSQKTLCLLATETNQLILLKEKSLFILKMIRNKK